jgi:hypothetical protein
MKRGICLQVLILKSLQFRIMAKSHVLSAESLKRKNASKDAGATTTASRI